MEWRVLGPVEVVVDGLAQSVGGPQQRGVLAYLLLNTNLVVSTNQLVDALWGGRAPASARTQVQGYVSRLRLMLKRAGAEHALTSQPAGYLLTVAECELDLARHVERTHQARAAAADGERAKAAELYRAALALWRGPALAGAAGMFVEPAAMRLGEQQLSIHEELAEVELAMGEHGSLVARLRQLLDVYPLRQRMVGQLMSALHRSGRQADALETFRKFRCRLGEEQGLDPGPDLVALHDAILRVDPQLSARHRSGPSEPTTGSSQASAVEAGRVPWQLPAAPSHFVGRHEELRVLDELLDVGDRATSVSLIAGSPGIGKTTLAVHWAHRGRDSFPDGQLYVNLRGFDPTAAAMTPSAAIHRILDALGVSAARIPDDLEAQASLYRSVLDGRRMLLLLDNARDADQIRPLLPGSATTLTLITSRNRLSSLIAVNGARLLTVGLFSKDDARQLLAQRLGATRVNAEPLPAEEIITRCARLPLALTIAVARAVCATQPLAAIAADLAEARSRLDTLSAGDAVTELRAVFSCSYDALTPATAELFRLLGLAPGPDISAAAAASLIGRPLAQTRTLLAELIRTSLLTEQVAGRYAFHDLLRIYAQDLAQKVDPPRRRHEAIGRLIDHYLHSAHTADRILDPHRDPIILAPPMPGATPEELIDHAAAMTWLRTEHPVLLAMPGMAAEACLHRRAWQLAWVLTTYLTRRGPWLDMCTVWQAAVTAALRLDDPDLQAHAQRMLGLAHAELGRHEEADADYRQAMRLGVDHHNRVEMAYTQTSLAKLRERQGRPAQALDHARTAYALFRGLSHRHGQARALNAIAWYQVMLDHHHDALVHCGQALTLFEEHGDRRGQADTWDTMGYAYHHMSRPDLAITCYQRALTVYRDLGDRYYEAAALIHLGESHDAADQPADSYTAWRQAAAILDDLNHPLAREVHAKLA